MSNIKAMKAAIAESQPNNYEGRGALRAYAIINVRDPQASDGVRSRRVNVSIDWHTDHEAAQRRVRELRDANPDLTITGRLTIDYF